MPVVRSYCRRMTSAPGSPGDVLTLISAGSATTRSDLARAHRPRQVHDQPARRRADRAWPGRGDRERRVHRRPAASPAPPAHRGTTPSPGVDLGATHCRIDADGHRRARCWPPARTRCSIADGPETVLAHVDERLDRLLAEAGGPGAALQGDRDGRARARSSSPPAGPTTRRSCPAGTTTRSPSTSQARLPVLVDNDVNVMALGEQRNALAGTRPPAVRQDRHRHRLRHRGRGQAATAAPQGSAGDIGHIRVDGHETRSAAAATAAAWRPCPAARPWPAQARPSSASPAETAAPRRRRALGTGGQHRRRSGWSARAAGGIGEVLASLVNFFNPEVIVIGGALSRLGHVHLLAEIRRRRLPPVAAAGHRQPADRALRARTGINAGVAGRRDARERALPVARARQPHRQRLRGAPCWS